jgi:cell division protein FtsL
MTYSNSLAIGRYQKNVASRHQNSISFKVQDRRLGPITNTIILIVLACLLGLLYLTQVTKTNTYGYQLNGLQQQQAQLQNQYSQLEVTSASLQAVSRVQTSPVAKALVAVTPSATVAN